MACNVQFCIMDSDISPLVCGVYKSEIADNITIPPYLKPSYSINYYSAILLGLKEDFTTQVKHVRHILFSDLPA